MAETLTESDFELLMISSYRPLSPLPSVPDAFVLKDVGVAGPVHVLPGLGKESFLVR